MAATPRNRSQQQSDIVRRRNALANVFEGIDERTLQRLRGTGYVRRQFIEDILSMEDEGNQRQGMIVNTNRITEDFADYISSPRFQRRRGAVIDIWDNIERNGPCLRNNINAVGCE